MALEGMLLDVGHWHVTARAFILDHCLRARVIHEVGGETLGERIRRRPLSIAECLRVALRIAETLEAANEKGIIHRDLKPSNVKITPTGTVKLLACEGVRRCADRVREER